MQIISNLPVYTGIIPNKATQTDNEFANNIFGFLNYSGNTFVGNFNTIVGQFNVLSEEINTTASQITLDKQTVLEAKDITLQAKEAALISKNEAAAIYDNFDDRYLGIKTSPPTFDNDGEPLRNGALYCKESTNPEENGLMYVYDFQLGDWVNLSFVPTLFASLTDVTLVDLNGADILKYDAVLGKWKNIPRDYYLKSETYNKTEINNFMLSLVPAGTVITFIGSTAPIGYIKGNGAILSRTTFANLWAFAQTSGALVSDSEWFNSNQGCFSTGDGSTTFRIPDLRGIVSRGWDDGRGIDPGRVLGSYQEDALKSHTHQVITPVEGAYRVSSGTSGYVADDSIVQTSSSTGSTETRPKNIALLYCIKY